MLHQRPAGSTGPGDEAAVRCVRHSVPDDLNAAHGRAARKWCRRRQRNSGNGTQQQQRQQRSLIGRTHHPRNNGGSVTRHDRSKKNQNADQLLGQNAVPAERGVAATGKQAESPRHRDARYCFGRKEG